MKRIFVFMVFVIGFSAQAAHKKIICVYSLLDDQQTDLLRQEVSEASQSTRTDHIIHIRKNLDFPTFVETARICHGLIISGHHSLSTGFFGQKRKLDLKTLNDFAQIEKNKTLFAGVKSVFLDGSHTAVPRVSALARKTFPNAKNIHGWPDHAPPASEAARSLRVQTLKPFMIDVQQN